MDARIVRKLWEALRARLQAKAAIRSRSNDDEAREISCTALAGESGEVLPIGSAIHAMFASLGGLDMSSIEREPMREPPQFERGAS